MRQFLPQLGTFDRFGHLVLICLFFILRSPALAQPTFPDRPGQHDFILDEADMVTDHDEQRIRTSLAKLLDERDIPVVIVTIDSLARYDAAHLTIDQYARRLFDHWGIGDADYNYGILLLVSEGDRRARIELGADWSGAHDRVAQKIMDDLLIASFKQGEFSFGIALAADGLAAMARGEEIPERPSNVFSGIGDVISGFIEWLGHYWIFGAFFVFWILSRVLGWAGSRVFGWHYSGFWGSGGFGGGGGFSGGSFGGGFSGGGGASGGW